MAIPKVEQLLEKLGISEEEALKAILSAVKPLPPHTLRQNWCRSSATGNSAPTTGEIWAKYAEADFRCSQCGSQLRITLDHRNGDAKDHSLPNLEVLCFECNRKKSKKGTVDLNHGLRIYESVMRLVVSLKRFPTNQEILAEAKVRQIGGATYLVKYLQKRLA